MRDGKTRRVKSPARPAGIESFLERNEAKLTVVSGPASGCEFTLDRPRTILGRGPGVDITVGDDAASRQHAAIEFCGDGFRIRDLASTNGLRVNDTPAQECAIDHGDYFEIGDHRFQLFLAQREPSPNTYVLTTDL